MNQTRLESLCEVLVNVVLGCVVSFVANIYVLPQIGCHPTVGQNLYAMALFTVISVARSYVIRRWFNAGIHKLATRIAQRILK